MLLHLLRSATILARQNLSPNMVVVVTNDDRATDTLHASQFPRPNSSACTLPCHQTRQSRHTLAFFLSLAPHPSPTQEPRSALAYRELVEFREPFSTHVKLQPMPKFIPMASCCAEEMLIAISPPFLDYRSFRHSRLCQTFSEVYWGRRIGWEADMIVNVIWFCSH
jgi:hypothetical protein